MQDAPPPDRVEEEGPDLRCLDHSFFSAESDRLLYRWVASRPLLLAAVRRLRLTVSRWAFGASWAARCSAAPCRVWRTLNHC